MKTFMTIGAVLLALLFPWTMVLAAPISPSADTAGDASSQDDATPAQLAAQAAQAKSEAAAKTAEEAARRAELARQILEGKATVHTDGVARPVKIVHAQVAPVDRKARAIAARALRKADSALSDKACGGDGRVNQLLMEANVASRSYVDARDRLNLQAAVQYTDDEVGKVQRQVNWLKTLLFLVFVLAVIACFLPRARRIVERVTGSSTTSPTTPPPPAPRPRLTTTPGVLEVELDDEPDSPSMPTPPPPASGATAYRFVAVEQSSKMLAIRPVGRADIPPPPAPRPRVLGVNTNARAVLFQRPAEQRIDGARPR